MKKFLIILSTLMMLLPLQVSAANRVAKLSNGAAPAEGYYYLIPACGTNRCLTMKGGSKVVGGLPVINATKASAHKIWHISPSLGGTWTITNKNSGMVLGAKNNTTTPGGVIRQGKFMGSNGQRWYIIKKGNCYVVQSSISKLVMGVVGNKNAAGQGVNLQKWSGATGQKWFLLKYTPTTATHEESTGTDSSSHTETPSQTVDISNKLIYGTTKKTGMSAADYAVLNNIIGAVETGGEVYGQRAYDDYTAPFTNSSIEYTCTLGWGAFYGEEAQLLVKTIKQRAPKTFANIDKKGIIAKQLETNWVESRWNPNAEEIRLLKLLITTTVGKQVQDELMTKLMQTYVAKCKSLYTNNTFALMMYSEIAHLGGTGAANRIFNNCKGDYTLDAIVASLKLEYNSDNKVGSKKFWGRHMKCVEFITKYAA